MNRIKLKSDLSVKNKSGTQNARVLLVDDNVDLLKLMSIRLRQMKLELRTVTSAEEALSILAIWPADLVITDLQMQGMSGMELFEILQYNTPMLPVIILTAHGTIPDAVEATQAGVASYLSKPFESDVLIKKVQEALESSGFNENRTINTFAMIRDNSWRNHIVSKSQKIRSLLTQIEKFAESDDLIMLTGEPGACKDDIAMAIHCRSLRASQPLVQIAGTTFIEKPFGREFFGAVDDLKHGITANVGVLQKANGGTLLITDFNEGPLKLVPQALQALIKKRASPVNSDKTYAVDVRVIITSAADKNFRQENQHLRDLASKVNLIRLSVPPLRERKEDIPGIIKQCLDETQPDKNMRFSPPAMQILLAAEWPGNVRQLTNLVKICAKLSNTSIISEGLVSSRIKSPIYRIAPLTNAHGVFERNYLTELLRVTNGNVTQAATIAKRNRTEFHRLLKKHQIKAKSYRQ